MRPTRIDDPTRKDVYEDDAHVLLSQHRLARISSPYLPQPVMAETVHSRQSCRTAFQCAGATQCSAAPSKAQHAASSAGDAVWRPRAS